MSSSIEQYFNEVQAVATILSEMVDRFNTDDGETTMGDGDFDLIPTEEFTALWQAVELLSRGATYIMAQMQAESAKAALFLPAPVEKKSGLITPDYSNVQVTKKDLGL